MILFCQPKKILEMIVSHPPSLISYVVFTSYCMAVLSTNTCLI